ncbi:MAG: glycosyltransferase family 39 protein [Patescibacteria group bacterium]
MFLTTKRFQQTLIIILIITAVFFRFYKIRDHVVFLGDEGRDMIVLRNIFLEKRLPFLGPSASVGGFYLGPIYYWMAAPFLLLSKFDPIGPSYMVALFGVGTVLLLYKFLKEAVGFWPAALASLLYATAPLIVRYSRSSWNPNPLPFFSLLLIYFIYKGIKSQKYLFFVGAGACLGVAIQLHYLALVLAPLAFFIILLNEKFRRIPAIAALAFLGFLITFSPFLIFEIRHNFPNFRSILEFVTRGNTVGYSKPNFIWTLTDNGNIFFEWISQITGTVYTRILFSILTVSLALGTIIAWKNKDHKLIFTIGVIYFIGGIFLLRSYAGQLYDYYLGSIFPAPFFVFGLTAFLFWKNLPLKIIVTSASILILGAFLSQGFYTKKPNMLILQTESIANFIIDKTDNASYNFALISNSNSDYAYRYFLDIKHKSPKKLEELVTDQLIVICESKECSPLGNPLWEIAGFGRAEIDSEWDLDKYGFKLYKLVHLPGEPSPAGKPVVKGI